MSPRTPAEVVSSWHEAVNAGDVEAAVAWCTEDVEVHGPRGVGNGHDLVRGWLRRSGIRLHPQHELTETDGRFVVHELAHWSTPDAPPEAPTEPTETWCVFTVRDGRLASIARYETREQVPSV